MVKHRVLYPIFSCILTPRICWNTWWGNMVLRSETWMESFQISREKYEFCGWYACDGLLIWRWLLLLLVHLKELATERVKKSWWGVGWPVVNGGYISIMEKAHLAVPKIDMWPLNGHFALVQWTLQLYHGPSLELGSNAGCKVYLNLFYSYIQTNSDFHYSLVWKSIYFRTFSLSASYNFILCFLE